MKDIVFSVQIHDTVFEMKFPLISCALDFVVLADDHVFSVKKVTGIPFGNVIAGSQGFILRPVVRVFVFILVFILIVIVVIVVLIVYRASKILVLVMQ